MKPKWNHMICIGCGEKIDLKKEKIYYKIERIVKMKDREISQIVYYHWDCPINFDYFREDIDTLRKNQANVQNFVTPKPDIVMF